MEYVIVSEYGCDTQTHCTVWGGHTGWFVVRKIDQPWSINQAHRYKTRAAAQAAIRRGRNKWPTLRWRDARIVNLQEARQDNNDLGLKWTMETA